MSLNIWLANTINFKYLSNLNEFGKYLSLVKSMGKNIFEKFFLDFEDGLKERKNDKRNYLSKESLSLLTAKYLKDV